MWSVTNFIIFLFIYKINGTPLGERPQSEEAEPSQFIPAQWGKDSKLAYTWPKGEVPYYFDTNSYDAAIKSRVLKAISALEADSCIRFKEQKAKPSKNSGSWLHFTNPSTKRDCFHEPSYKANGEIGVVLGYDCLKQRDITHAVMHGIGFRDEVAHPQRDLYVKIMWANIQPAYRAMFRIQPMEHAAGLLEYDPMSIMHFHDRAFSLNGQATVTALLSGLKINPSDELSHLDKMKLRIMFGHECNKRKVGEVLDTCQGILSEDSPSPQDEKSNDNQNSETTVKPDKIDEDVSNEQDVGESNKEDKETEHADPKEEVIIVGDKVEDVDENAAKNNYDEKPVNVDPKEEIIIVGDKVEDVDENAAKNNYDEKPVNVDPKEEIIIVGDRVEDVDENAAKNNYDKKPVNVDPKEEIIIVGDRVEDVDENAAKNNYDKKPVNVDPKEEIIIVGDKLDDINTAKDKKNKNDYNSQNKLHEGFDNENSFNGNENAESGDKIFVVGDNKLDNNNQYEDKDDMPNEEGDDPNEEFVVVGDKKYDDNENEYPNAQNGNKKTKNSEELVIVGDNVDGGNDDADFNGDDDDVNGNKNIKISEEIIIAGDNVEGGNDDAYSNVGNDDIKGNKSNKKLEKIIVVGDDVEGGNDDAYSNGNNGDIKGNKNNKKLEKIIVVGDEKVNNENDQEDVQSDNAVVILNEGPDEEKEAKASYTRKLDKKEKAKQEILSNEEDDNTLKGNVVHNENLQDTD